MIVTMIIIIIIADDDCDKDTHLHHHDCHRRYIELTEDDKEKLKGSYKVLKWPQFKIKNLKMQQNIIRMEMLRTVLK